MQILNFSHLNIHLSFKHIKNIYLKVLPPEGTITICAPHQTPIELIKKFVYQKLAWIMNQQKKIQQMSFSKQLNFFGQEIELVINHSSINNDVQLKGKQIILYVPKHFSQQQRNALLLKFFKNSLFKKCQEIIGGWEKKLKVKVNKLSIRNMKTRWGSCTPSTANIRINLKLIHLEEKYLEYVIVHELVHLLEASHNHRFKTIMSMHLPNWRTLQQELNQLHLNLESNYFIKSL